MLDGPRPTRRRSALALDDIIKNDRRAGAVIDRLRALLRKGDITLQPIELNDVVRDVIDLAFGELASRRVSVTSASRREFRSCWAIASNCSRWCSTWS